MKKNLNIYISKFKFKINLKLKYFLNVMLKYILTNFIVAISIPLLDLGLCLIYNKKARWFQLHAAVNFVILTISFITSLTFDFLLLPILIISLNLIFLLQAL